MYVGKARDLFRRVKQYFSESDAVGEKTAILRSQIVDLETIVTESEFDALLLEAKLIRRLCRRLVPRHFPRTRLSTFPIFHHLLQKGE